MPCNLNFNQCNSFNNFPRPIFNCYQNFLSLLNQSGTTIINPVIESASIITEISSSQTILAGGNAIPSTTFSQGSAIFYDNNGTFTLIKGRYIISYNFGGIIASNGASNYGIYLDGVLLPSSLSQVSGVTGENSNHSGSVFVEITAPTGAITIRNSNNLSQIINNGSISIQKII